MRKLYFLLILLFTIACPAYARYVSISWNPVDGATSYKLYWGPNSGGPYTYNLDVGNVTTYQLAINEEETFMVVAASDGSGEGAASGEIKMAASTRNKGPILQTFTLTSDLTGTHPFTVGLVFKKRDTTNPTLDIDDYSCVVKRTWNDGSVKHAICSGSVAMSADTPKSINVYSAGALSKSIALTEADIVKAAPTALVKLGSLGTVSLSSLLGSPIRTWISTPEMVEAHYASLVGSEKNVVVQYHVRLYKSGGVWVRAIAENGSFGVTNSDATYVPEVVIGDKTVWDNSSESFTHHVNTRWAVEGWVGVSDPNITIAQDSTYMDKTKLIPHYWKTGPDEDVLNGNWSPPYAPKVQKQHQLIGIYDPGDTASWWQWQGNPGFQTSIGLLPWWDALYITSGGDKRAYNSLIANAKAANSFPIIFKDVNTLEPIIISDYPAVTLRPDGGGTDVVSIANGGIKWERNHHGSAGYLAYLVTGDYYYLETMQSQATLLYLSRSIKGGKGTGRIFSGSMQGRGIAWSLRTISQLAAVAPIEDEINSDLIALFSNNVDYWLRQSQIEGQNQLGFLYTRTFYPVPRYPDNSLPPWQHNWWAAVWGMAVDMEPLTDGANLNSIAQWFYKIPVGLTGGSGIDSYCFTRCAEYTLSVSATTTYDTTQWFDSWGDAYRATTGSPNTDCGGKIKSPEIPATYLAYLLPALAYAVDHGATGATESLARLEGATNWSTFENSGFENTPIWGIYPRSIATSSH